MSRELTGKAWIEPLDYVIRWRWWGLKLRTFHEKRHGSHTKRMPNEDTYFDSGGVAFSTIGNLFSARLYRYLSVYDAAGCHVFSTSPETACCLLNSEYACDIVSGLNPSIVVHEWRY